MVGFGKHCILALVSLLYWKSSHCKKSTLYFIRERDHDQNKAYGIKEIKDFIACLHQQCCRDCVLNFETSLWMQDCMCVLHLF